MIIFNLVNTVFLVLYLAACGKGTTAPAQIDPVFQKFVDSFNTEAGKYGSPMRVSDIEMSFKDLSSLKDLVSAGEVLYGNCHTAPEQERQVFIDPTYWGSFSDARREELVFHELGHCVLDLGHDSALINADIPESVMYPTLPDEKVYSKNRDWYVRQLFTQSEGDLHD